MRIVRVKLTEEVKDLLKAVSHRLAITDNTFVEDAYALVHTRGNGLPDSTRSEALAKHYAAAKGQSPAVVKTLISKRAQVLGAIIKSGTFASFVKNPVINEIEFTEELLLTFKQLHKKLRQAECLSCLYHPDCAFGKQYSKTVTHIECVIDPDWKLKVHDKCPKRPEIETTNAIYAAAVMANSLANPHNANAFAGAVKNTKEPPQLSLEQIPGPELPPGLSPSESLQIIQSEIEAQELANDFELDCLSENVEEEGIEDMPGFRVDLGRSGSRLSSAYRTHHFRQTLVHLDSKLVDRIKIANLVIYELARKLDTLLEKHKKGMFKPVSKLTKTRQIEQIKSHREVSSVLSSQHALPNDVFEAKLVKKSLIKEQHIDPESKKQLLYILLDTSGSMEAFAAAGGEFGFCTRGNLAMSFTLALSRRVRDDKGIMFMRCFEGAPSALRECRTEEDFARMEKFIIDCGFDGGGTNIPKAIYAAAEDINKANKRNELARAEILLITDAGDFIADRDIIQLRKALKDVPINVLDVAGMTQVYDPVTKTYVNQFVPNVGAVEPLIKLSDNYFRVDPTKPLVKMIDLIGGKKKGQNKNYENKKA